MIAAAAEDEAGREDTSPGMLTMTKVHGPRTLAWIAPLFGLALGSMAVADSALGQDEVRSIPRELRRFGGGEGSQYAGLDYNPRTFGATRRLGSVMPPSADDIPQGGEIIYEGEPRFIAAEGEEPLPMPREGEIIYESGPLPSMGNAVDVGPCEACGEDACAGCGTEGECASCGTWDGCGRADCEQCISLCLPRFRHLTLFGGVQGFKGPRDNGTNSNFGFHEGFAVSGRAPFVGWRGIGYQFGYRTTQTRLHGDLVDQDGRSQHFLTGGLFRRSQVGLQYGVAYDWLRDDLTEEVDLSQLRTELSVLGPRGGEVGFLGMFHTNSENVFDGNATTEFQSVNQYLLFFRRRFENCGEGRLWGGFTDNDAGIFGGEFLVPLDDRWSLSGGFNYLIPEEDSPPQAAIQEAWNIGISLVWHWRCDAKAAQNSPFRPLFNVADNGTMIIGRP